MPKPAALLLDLDGTLADTAPDLAHALNATLSHFGANELPFAQIRPAVSHGGAALIQLGFGISNTHPDFAERRAFLLDLYQSNIARHTALFHGMEEILDLCHQHDIPWGVVTNKPTWLTQPLMQAMDLAQRAGCIVSGDTCEHSKPHPEPLLHACALLQVNAGDCLYVGDAKRDIEAAQNAGMASAAALWGYIGEDDNPAQWQADFTFSQPHDLREHLAQRCR